MLFFIIYYIEFTGKSFKDIPCTSEHIFGNRTILLHGL